MEKFIPLWAGILNKGEILHLAIERVMKLSSNFVYIYFFKRTICDRTCLRFWILYIYIFHGFQDFVWLFLLIKVLVELGALLQTHSHDFWVWIDGTFMMQYLRKMMNSLADLVGRELDKNIKIYRLCSFSWI